MKYDKNLDLAILRNAVVGYVVIRIKRPDGSFFISLEPLVADCEGAGDFDGTKIEEIIGILPALPGTFKVSAFNKADDSEVKDLGYEYAGATNPKWVETYKTQTETLKSVKLQVEKYKSNIEVLRDIIRQLQVEHDGAAHLDLIIAKAIGHSGMTINQVIDILQKLKNAGEILESSENRFRVV